EPFVDAGVVAVAQRRRPPGGQGRIRRRHRHRLAPPLRLTRHLLSSLFGRRVHEWGSLARERARNARSRHEASGYARTAMTPPSGTPTDLTSDVTTGPPTGVPTGGDSGPATPIDVTAEELAGVAWNADGLVPAIVQEQGTGQVLML